MSAPLLCSLALLCFKKRRQGEVLERRQLEEILFESKVSNSRKYKILRGKSCLKKTKEHQKKRRQPQTREIRCRLAGGGWLFKLFSQVQEQVFVCGFFLDCIQRSVQQVHTVAAKTWQLVEPAVPLSD